MFNVHLKKTLWAAIAAALLGCGDGGSNNNANPDQATLIVPQDIPPGYDYPGVRSVLQVYADQNDVVAMRRHSWNLWAGMTTASEASYNGAVLPIWETWCGTQEVFDSKTCGLLSMPKRQFEAPNQHAHFLSQGVSMALDNTQVVSFNKYNPAAANFLAKRHAQNGGLYDYTNGSDLVALNASWPQFTPISERSIIEAPYTPSSSGVQGSAAIETKPVMLYVKATGLTAIPLWRGPADSWNLENPTPETWKTCVLIDPASTAPAGTPPVPYDPNIHPGVINRQNTDNGGSGETPGCLSNQYLYAPMSTLYTFKMTAEEAVQFNKAQGGTAVAGDYAALVAMHVSTKEIKNWVWQTFWWQPGPDTLNNFPGNKLNMTDNVKGLWRNFAMCTVWYQTQGATSEQMNVCFNPYLETSPTIPSGLTSNCMSCHGTATVGVATPNAAFPISSLPYPPHYRNPINFDGLEFAPFTKTDFMWSIQNNAAPPK